MQIVFGVLYMVNLSLCLLIYTRTQVVGYPQFPQPKTLNPKLSGNPFALCSFHADCLVLHFVCLLPSSDANCLGWV